MLEQFLILVIWEKAYLVKICPIFVSSPLAFGARYQSFLRVCLFLHEGVTNFVYQSEKLNNPMDDTDYKHMISNLYCGYFLGERILCGILKFLKEFLLKLTLFSIKHIFCAHKTEKLNDRSSVGFCYLISQFPFSKTKVIIFPEKQNRSPVLGD